MTESLRDTLIAKGWVTGFNADTLVKLIERHYAEETGQVAPKVTQSSLKVKLVQITRTIDPKTRIHYLDGIDEQGRHWVAQMTHRVEDWITYCKPWQLAPQFPIEL